MPAWSRELATTINEYVRGYEDAIIRQRKLLALMREKGRITFDHGGLMMDWGVKYKRAPMQGYADQDVLTFSRRDRWKRAQLEYRGYAATDAMTKKERLANKSTEALIKVYSEIAPAMMDDMKEQFHSEMYIDGNAAGNEKRIHGIESFMGVSGAATNGFVATPSDTYAGLSTILGNYSGSWDQSGGATIWPDGDGDPDYDFWSPLIVDYTDTAWSASTKTWPNTCLEALRYGIIGVGKNAAKDGMLDMIMLNSTLYRQFLDKLQTEEQINVKRGEGDGGLYKLGFRDVVNFDGVDVTKEHGVPTTVGYGWTMKDVELCSMQGQLFVAEGPFYDEETKTTRFSIDFFGNLRFKQVRNFVKFDNVT